MQLNLTTTDNVYPWPILALSDTTAVSALYNSGLAKFMYTSGMGPCAHQCRSSPDCLEG